MRNFIDKHKLKELVDQGKSQIEMAEFFGVSPSAVCQSLRRLNVMIAREVGVIAAPKIADRSLNAIDKLFQLTHKCEIQLDWIEENKLKIKKNQSQGDDFPAWQDQFLKFAGEIRRLITALADIRIKIYQAEKVERALTIMYEEIRRESPECQKRIADRFIRSGITFHTDG